ncbi:MAG TPA: right-handed parallel beta-helix repeat-containing protein, partial [Candidatus Thermoplasmatota archaeon]
FQPIAVINVSAGALFVIEDGTVSPRDAAAPYAILLSDGGRALWGNATVRGGNVTSPLSAIRLRSAVADLVGGEVSRWHLPLEATDSVVTVDGTRFADSWTGPRLSGGTARLANVTSQSNAGDGFGATAVTSLHLTAFSAFNNGGAGARLDAVVFAALAGYDARANGAAGLRAEGTHVEAQGLSLVGNAEEGLALVGSSYARIEAVEANSNLRSGVSLADVASFEIRGLTAHGNGGSGLVVAGASRGTVTGASIRQNSAFAVHATGGVSLTVTGADLADDVLGALRLEGSVEVSLRAASISSPADYAIAAIDDVNLTMTDVVSTAVVAVLIASDNAQVLAINCSIGSPIVVSQAVVRIGWHVRVVVQDASGGPGAGVAVTVRDAGGAAVANGTTGPSGVLPLMAVVERAHYGDGTRLTYGPHTIVAQSAALGRARVTENVSRFLTVGLRLDALPPTLDVEFSSTSGVTGWFLGPVGITLRAFDDRADGVTMSYRVLGGPWLDAASNTSGATVTIEVEAEGVTLIEVLLRDHAGNERGPETVEVRVDLAAPSGSFGPADAVYFVPSFVPSWSGTDGRGSGVANYRVEYAVNNGPYVMFLNGTTLRQAAFSATDADYRFRLTVFDVAGRASPPAYIDVSFALLGAFRVRVLDASGAAISNTSVLVEDLNVSLSGEGDLEITGLPAGAHTIVVSAPGHGAVRMEVNITARQTVDLGEVVLRPEAGGMPTELVVLWGLLAGVGAATIGYWVYLRQKWTRPRGPKKEEP